MNILWLGDANVSSGFAQCTHAVCDELHHRGHTVNVLGINSYGDPHDKPYHIWSPISHIDGGADMFGVGRLPRLINRLKPDVVVLLTDPWNVQHYFASMKQRVEGDLPPVIGWIAVDGMNQQAVTLNQLSHVVVWTEFAKKQLTLGDYNGSCDIVPLGVDHEIFKPGDKSSARKAIGCGDDDVFIVGMCGRNQERKCHELAIQAFKRFTFSAIDDARLFLHVAPTGENSSDIPLFVRFMGLEDVVSVSNPSIRHGLAVEHLVNVYRSMDVFLNTSSGEGWGLPVLEAMACGTPTIVPDFAALSEWTKDASYKVPCYDVQLTMPIEPTGKYVVGMTPDIDEVAKGLSELYFDEQLRDTLISKGLEVSSEFSWKRTGIEVADTIERVHGEITVSANDPTWGEHSTVISVSPRVRREDFDSLSFKERLKELGVDYKIHRKYWEWVTICQVYLNNVVDGGVIGFGVGREPVACWMAAQKATVLATDQLDGKDWDKSDQHAKSRHSLYHPGVCSDLVFSQIGFDFVDMNHMPLPQRADSFDFAWSSGAFEHLGSIKRGLQFFLNQMKLLRPGGWCVHTTEYAFSGDVLENNDIVLFRDEHLRQLKHSLEAQGDKLLPLSLHKGGMPDDDHVDAPPYVDEPHLSVLVGGYATTSIALIAQRGK